MNKIKIITWFILIGMIKCCEDITLFSSQYYNLPSDIFHNINLSHPKQNTYQSILDKFVRQGVPGAVMLIKCPEYGIWAGASGLADIGSNVKMQINHIFRIASITKMLTAVTLLTLVDQNKVNLDDKACRWLPNDIVKNIDNLENVTIRQLLNHTSGIVNYNTNLNFLLDCLNDPIKIRTWKDFLEIIYNKDAYFNPGAGFEYSNSNYVLIGLIINNICNTSHSFVLKNNITSPLNLTSTFYNPNGSLPEGLVRGYIDFHNDGTISDVRNIHNSIKLHADAGVISNAYDMMIFVDSLFNGKVLTEESLKEVKKWTSVNVNEKYGLGLSLFESVYGQYIGHTGSTFGYMARLFYFPEKEITFVLLTNGALGKISTLISNFTKTEDNSRNEIFDAIFSQLKQ